MLARLRGEAASLADWPLDEVQRSGLATGLTALAGSLGVFDGAGADVVAYVEEQRGQVAARADRFRVLTPQVLGALTAADIAAVPVKGAILGGSSGDPAVWDDPALRPMSDIDLLVEPRHRAAAAAVLVRGGSRLHASEDHEDTFLAWGDGSVGRTDGESADHNGRIEVHPGWVEFLHGYSVHGFDPVARAARRADGQHRLDPASFAVHVIGHLASTVVRAEVRAVNVLDVWFLHRRGLDWDAIAIAMRDVDPRLTAPGLWIADRTMTGVVPPALLAAQMTRLPPSRHLLRLEPAAVMREPTQRTTARWRAAFATGVAERAGVARQLGRSAVGRVR